MVPIVDYAKKLKHLLFISTFFLYSTLYPVSSYAKGFDFFFWRSSATITAASPRPEEKKKDEQNITINDTVEAALEEEQDNDESSSMVSNLFSERKAFLKLLLRSVSDGVIEDKDELLKAPEMGYSTLLYEMKYGKPEHISFIDDHDRLFIGLDETTTVYDKKNEIIQKGLAQSVDEFVESTPIGYSIMYFADKVNAFCKPEFIMQDGIRKYYFFGMSFNSSEELNKQLKTLRHGFKEADKNALMEMYHQIDTTREGEISASIMPSLFADNGLKLNPGFKLGVDWYTLNILYYKDPIKMDEGLKIYDDTFFRVIGKKELGFQISYSNQDNNPDFRAYCYARDFFSFLTSFYR